MDPLTLVGIILGVGAVLVGQHLEGGSLLSLLNGPALLIVLGGSIGAAMVQSPVPQFLRAMRLLAWVWRPPTQPAEETLAGIVRWAQVVRKEGLLGLERMVARIDDAFIRKGLQLVVDGSEPESIRQTLELDIDASESRDLHAARVIEGIGGYAPTLGILGAVMGLIQVMRNLADPAELGGGIAVAFVATIYGVGFANLLFLPAANKLKACIRARSDYYTMVAEGLVAIAEGENPRLIEARLQALVNR